MKIQNKMTPQNKRDKEFLECLGNGKSMIEIENNEDDNDLDYGEASIYIELRNETVKVYHGQDKSLLYKAKVKSEYWKALWKTIKSKKYIVGDKK